MASKLKNMVDSGTGPFNDENGGVKIAYPVPSFPILNYQLGCIYIYNLPDGSVYTYRKTGIDGAQFLLITGDSQSGKTTACVQMAWDIVSPFGADAEVYHIDAERSSDYNRVQILTKATTEQLKQSYHIHDEIFTFEAILALIKSVCEKKEADKDRYMYNSGIKNLFGNDMILYKPTVIIADSLKKLVSEKEAETISDAELSDGMSGGREAVFRGKFYKAVLEYMYKYNIIFFMIHHLNDDLSGVQNRFAQKPKALTYMPNGKAITGGELMKLLTSTMIDLTPMNAQADRWTVEENGYKAHRVKWLIYKARTGDAVGQTCTNVFVPASGYDPKLTLMEWAETHDLVSGIGQNCHLSETGTRFNRKKLLSEFETKPQLFRELITAVKPLMDEMLPVFDFTGQKTGRNEETDLLKEMGLA